MMSDREIVEYVRNYNMIDPFVPNTVSEMNHISYGLSSASYEVRIQSKFKIFTNAHSQVIDPLDFNDNCYVTKEADEITIPPYGFVLCLTLERIQLPNNVSVLCIGKSTYARCGIIVNPTALDAGVNGNIVLELSNTSPCPVILRAGNNGVAKLVFFRMNESCDLPYCGNYQNQTDIILPTTKRRYEQS